MSHFAERLLYKAFWHDWVVFGGKKKRKKVAIKAKRHVSNPNRNRRNTFFYSVPGPWCWRRARSRRPPQMAWWVLYTRSALKRNSEMMRMRRIFRALEGWHIAENVRWNTFSFRSIVCRTLDLFMTRNVHCREVIPSRTQWQNRRLIRRSCEWLRIQCTASAFEYSSNRYFYIYVLYIYLYLYIFDRYILCMIKKTPKWASPSNRCRRRTQSCRRWTGGVQNLLSLVSVVYVQIVGVIDKALEPFFMWNKRAFPFQSRVLDFTGISQELLRVRDRYFNTVCNCWAGFSLSFFFSFISGGYRCRVIMKERAPSTKICTNCITLACLSEIKHLVIDE